MTSTSRGRGRIGVLVPFTNTNLEADVPLLRPEGVSMHFARLGGYDVDEVPDSKQMAGLGSAPLDEPLKLLLGTRPDVIVYGCTSATLAHGPSFDRDLAKKISTLSNAATVTAAGALVYALNKLNIRRVGFTSPYVSELNDRAISFLSESGIETVSRHDVDAELGNHEQGNLSPDAVIELGKQADSPEAEAIVLSCTDMRSVEVIERLEAILDKPVISSNQAMMFEALEKMKIDPAEIGCGRLFESSD